MTTHPTAAVRGTARTTVDPDYADVHLTVTHAGTSRELALAGVAAKLVTVQELIEDLAGVQEAHLAHPRCRQERYYDKASGRNVAGDWIAAVGGTVRLDATTAPADLARLLASEASVTYVSWGLVDHHPARRQVRIDAVAVARQAAEDFAVGTGCTLGDLVSIADPGVGGTGAVGSWGRAAGSPAEAEVEVDPEPVEISATVEAVYELHR